MSADGRDRTETQGRNAEALCAEYAGSTGEHWWWRSREAILLDLLTRLVPAAGALEILDVGCGDGLFFPELERFGRVRGIEVDEGLLDPDGPYRPDLARPLGDAAYQGDDWRFDLITALDVIEHIADDRAAVSGHGPDAPSRWRDRGHRARLPGTVGPPRRDQPAPSPLHIATRSAAVRRSAVRLLQLRYLFRGLFWPKYLVARLNRRRTA